jgi:glycosyltransferase involved in cell wall biosynthesis
MESMQLKVDGSVPPHMTVAGTLPLVSVVIPCYNHARYLPQAIDSALSQTYTNIELVVVDDGSADNTSEVVGRYANVRYLFQANQGVARARNFGLDASKGDFIQFLDADDRLTRESVESHMRCFAAHPEAGFVVGDIEWVGEDDQYIGRANWPVLEANHYEELLKVNHIANTIAVLFRRSVLGAVGGFNGFFSPAEDYEILLRAARAFPSAHHATVVAQYRRHASNTSRHGALMLKATNRVMISERNFVSESPRLKTALRKGDQHWRDFFGAVTVKEIYSHISRGELGAAAAAAGALLRYVRGRLVILPWKYRSRGMAGVRRMLGRFKKGAGVTGKSSVA